MRTVLKLGGLAFAVLLDVSVAIFLIHTLGIHFGQELRWWQYLVIAPMIGVFPDLDALLQYFTTKKIDDGHHSFMHIPPLMILLGFALGSLFFSQFWGVVIAVTWFFHFVHDSSMWDFGLKWLWPFTNKQYHFLGRKQIGQSAEDRERRFRLIVSYTPEELAKLEREEAFVDLDTWLCELYYKPSLIGGLEVGASSGMLGAHVLPKVTGMESMGTEFMLLLIGFFSAFSWMLGWLYRKVLEQELFHLYMEKYDSET